MSVQLEANPQTIIILKNLSGSETPRSFRPSRNLGHGDSFAEIRESIRNHAPNGSDQDLNEGALSLLGFFEYSSKSTKNKRTDVMKISEVNIQFIKPADGLIGFASLVIDDPFYLGSIGIHQKLDGTGYRLTYPTKKSPLANRPIFHPINRSISQAIEQAIFMKLKKVMSKAYDRLSLMGKTSNRTWQRLKKDLENCPISGRPEAQAMRQMRESLIEFSPVKLYGCNSQNFDKQKDVMND